MEQDKNLVNLHTLLTPGQICNIIGISRRQLQYWDMTGLISPTYKTDGGHGRYTFQDLVALKAARKLIDAGVSVQRIRKSLKELKGILPKIKRPLEELTLVATGDLILVFHEETVFEAFSGQEWILDIADIYRDVEKWKKKSRAIKRYRRPEAIQSMREKGKKVSSR